MDVLVVIFHTASAFVFDGSTKFASNGLTNLADGDGLHPKNLSSVVGHSSERVTRHFVY
jgi:hypothetical protein